MRMLECHASQWARKLHQQLLDPDPVTLTCDLDLDPWDFVIEMLHFYLDI